MKLKQNSFKTVLKLFCFGFISLGEQFYIVLLRTHDTFCNAIRIMVMADDSYRSINLWDLTIRVTARRMCEFGLAMLFYLAF